MVELTTEQRIFVVTQFTRTPNVTVAGKQFRIRFPELFTKWVGTGG